MALTRMFDTHQAVKELTEAGFAEAQAEAVVATIGKSMGENVATKADISELRAEVKTDIAEVKTAIAEVKTDVAGVKADITVVKADIASVRTDMAALEMRIIVKMTGVVLAIVSLGVAFLKLFP